jgi:hypothetical protein
MGSPINKPPHNYFPVLLRGRGGRQWGGTLPQLFLSQNDYNTLESIKNSISEATDRPIALSYTAASHHFPYIPFESHNPLLLSILPLP